MKKILIANWKMNPQGFKEAKNIFNEIKKQALKLKKVEIVVCPPFIYIPILSGGKINIGAQDIFYENKGAFTGEISAKMLKDANVKYVIIGHSERRALGESDELLNKKLKAALGAGLKTIFCVGEPERDIEGNYLQFVKNQIEVGLKDIPRKNLKNLLIAYEPVWAISSQPGARADTSESAFRMGIYIRKTLLPIMGNVLARNISVLYGGSVNVQNAQDFFANSGMDGALVGGQSLIAKNFNQILKFAEITKVAKN